MYSTGVGKVLLAHAPEDVRNRVLAGPLKPFTRHTITTPGLLRRQLDRAITEGYATTAEEMTLGACSVAVPITTGSDVVGSLGIVVSDLRRNRLRLVSALKVAAQGVSRALP